MSVKFELELLSGQRFALDLPPPGPLRSCYFVFEPDADEERIWPFVAALLAAARQPNCAVISQLRNAGLRPMDVAPHSLRECFRQEGYAFGILRHFKSLSIDLDDAGRKTLLFVRDPRNAVAEAFAASGKVPFDQFLGRAQVADIVDRSQLMVEFCRARRHVEIFRVEDFMTDSRGSALRLAAVLGCDIASDQVLEIADRVGLVGAGSGDPLPRELLGSGSQAILETKLARVLVALGYASGTKDAAGASLVVRPKGATSAVSNGAKDPSPSAPSHGLSTQDPDLRWRLLPNASMDMMVLGRRVTMQVDDFGCRPVKGQLPIGEKTFAAYGCSLTFGTAIAAEETFCSRLQSMFPTWRIENHGVGGYSSLQNLIQLERESRFAEADYVTFCWIEAHLSRNVASVSWAQRLMQGLDQERLRGVPMRGLPCARLGPEGELVVASYLHPRWDLVGLDLTEFAPDRYYLDLVCAKIFQRARAIVEGYGGRFFVTILWDRMSPHLRRLLAESQIAVLDASLAGLEYTCLPDDGHPNARANQIFAERIRDYLRAREAKSNEAATVP